MERGVSTALNPTASAFSQTGLAETANDGTSTSQSLASSQLPRDSARSVTTEAEFKQRIQQIESDYVRREAERNSIVSQCRAAVLQRRPQTKIAAATQQAEVELKEKGRNDYSAPTNAVRSR